MDQQDTISANSSRFTDDSADHYLTNEFKIGATVYLAVIDIFIVCGNSWVMYKLLANIRKSMCCLASLVVSDLLTGIISIPLYLLWLHDIELFVSKHMCIGSMMASLFLCVASIFNIIVLTVERYIAICFPFFHKSFMKMNFRVLVSVVISTIWILSFIIALVSLFFTRHFSACSYYNVYDSDFLVWTIIFGVFCPFCLLSAMYIRMFVMVRRSFRRETGVSASSCSSEKRQKSINKSLNKMAVTLCLVLVSFILCWGPFFLTMLLRLVCSSCIMPLLAYEVILLLGMTNSLTNPLIYCLRHKSFRTLHTQRNSVFLASRPINDSSLER